MGLADTAAPPSLRRWSLVRPMMASATADSGMMGGPYSSLSSSCSLQAAWRQHMYVPAVPCCEERCDVGADLLGRLPPAAGGRGTGGRTGRAPAPRLQRRGVVHHLHDQGPPGPHLHFTNVEPELQGARVCERASQSAWLGRRRTQAGGRAVAAAAAPHPKKRLQQGRLAVRLPANGHDFRYGQAARLAKGHGCRLQAAAWHSTRSMLLVKTRVDRAPIRAHASVGGGAAGRPGQTHL